MKGRVENLMLKPVVLTALIKKRKVHYDELKKNLEGDQLSFKECVTFKEEQGSIFLCRGLLFVGDVFNYSRLV